MSQSLLTTTTDNDDVVPILDQNPNLSVAATVPVTPNDSSVASSSSSSVPPGGIQQDEEEEEGGDVDLNTSSSSGSGSGLDCPICLQSCLHPVELPCHHIFCFMCIKGVIVQNPSRPRCAICRRDVPPYVLNNPNLKNVQQLYKSSTSGSGYLWYYESRGGGWWEFDERTMQEVERAYETKQSSTQLLIAGHMYDIDFDQMIQYRSGNPAQSRRIKRDVPRSDKRGIAGIRFGPDANNPSTSAGSMTFPTMSTPTPTGNSSQPLVRSSQTARRGGRRANSAHSYTASANLQSVIDAVATNSDGLSSPPGATNSVTFSLPNGHGPLANGVDHDAETESEHDEDSLDDDDDDEDMELGDEEETEEEDDYGDYYDGRDGARAPTSRSDRSTSSNHYQTPPPVDAAGDTSGSGSASRSSSSIGVRTRGRINSTPVDSSSGSRPVSGAGSALGRNPFSPVPAPDSSVSLGRRSLSTPTSPTANIRVGPIGANTPVLIGSSNGNGTCIQIGPTLRITVDYDTAGADDEVL